MRKYPFVIRVYGLYINASNEVLVSDEFVYGHYVTKFPGGGLEFGEGTIDCLRREMMEEVGHSFEVLEHFYTTDFFVPSAFNPEIQVMSVYYLMQPLGELNLKTSSKPFDFDSPEEGAQSLRWMALEKINTEDFQLVIDRHVAGLLKSRYSSELP